MIVNTETTARAILGFVVEQLNHGGIGAEPGEHGKGLYVYNVSTLSNVSRIPTDRMPDALELSERRGYCKIRWDYPDRKTGRGGFWYKPTIEGRVLGERYNDEVKASAAAEAKKTSPPRQPAPAASPPNDGLTLDDLHVVVREASESLLKNGHFPEAVFAAFKAVNKAARAKVGRGNDEGVKMMFSIFSPDPGK